MENEWILLKYNMQVSDITTATYIYDNGTKSMTKFSVCFHKKVQHR